MGNENNKAVGILPQFDRLVKPLGEEKIRKLKEELPIRPELRVIRTWRGKHLLDREKYELCKELNLPVIISEQFFEDWMGAAEYICREQLKDKELPYKYQRYLVGQLLHYILKRKNGDTNKNERKMDIADEVGKEWHLTGCTVAKYGYYSEAVNDLFAQSEELARMVLSEKVSISQENVVELSHLKAEEIQAIANTIERENVSKITRSFIRNEVKLCHIKVRGTVSRKEKEEQEISRNVGIRQMPKYDPDAEVNSLCMTIDSWISSVQRVRNSENFEKITEKASLTLMKKMATLEYNINEVQEILVERMKL